MKKWKAAFPPAVLGMLGAVLAMGQSPCPTQVLLTSPTKSNELVCLIPQVYGAGGLVGVNNGGPLDSTTGHAVHFQASSVQSFGPINSEIGIQLSQLPLAAPVSGFIFSGGVVTESSTFGPILTDRAETLGRGKIFLGASYQYFRFDKADGVDLKNFGAVFTHEQEPGLCGNYPTVPCINDQPIFVKDIVATVNRVDLKVHQVTLVGTVGVTSRVDVSIAVPVLDVRMAIGSNARIYAFEPPPVQHVFNINGVQSSTDSFFNSAYSSGLGDITLRGKYLLKQTERSALAVGADLRLHTGDPKNFLGSGTWGFRPFMTYTGHLGKVSPHGTIGFQGNGQSLLAGDITAQTPLKQHLPDVASYSAGLDGSVGHAFGYAVDIIDQSILQGTAIRNSTFTDYQGQGHPDITTSTTTINLLSASAGVKFAVGPNLLVTANGLFRLNDAGLHSKAAPLIGISYVF